VEEDEKLGAGGLDNVRLTRLRIVEECCTLRCPKCKQVPACFAIPFRNLVFSSPDACDVNTQAFIDFSGCCALTCHYCKCGFCALCQLDCGQNAHPHVKQCPLNPIPGEYFIPEASFQQIQATQFKLKVIAAFAKLTSSKTIKEKIFILLEKDLAYLGVVLTRKNVGL
jgi:hypothetical protein